MGAIYQIDDELCPCPFHPSFDAPLHLYVEGGDGRSWIECSLCRAEGPHATSRELAVIQWNDRRGLGYVRRAVAYADKESR